MIVYLNIVSALSIKDNLNCFRLPIVQGGGSLAFVGPTFSILSLPQWRCPDLSGKLTSIKYNFIDGL